MAAMILAFLIALAVANADCPTGCNTCDGTTCTSCLNTFYLTAGTCTACSGACPSGQYQDAACTATADRHCSGCPLNCNTCNGPTICQACNSGYFRINGGGCQACGATCPLGQYYNSALCLPNAYSSGCTPCSAGACPNGYFESASCSSNADRTCTACTTSCPQGTYQSAACSAFSDIQCLACGAQIEGCQACSVASGVVTCTSCGDGSQGWFLSGGTCAACSTNCASGYYRSLSCSANADISCSLCSGACPSGQYQDTACGATADRHCTACSSQMPHCATCSSANTCTSCDSSYYVSGGGTGCTGCFSTNCNTCTAGNYASCTSCVQGMYLNNQISNCTACKTSCIGSNKLYGVCTSHSNTACTTCLNAWKFACDPPSTQYPEAFWPTTLSGCCAQAKINFPDVGSECSRYNYVLTCTQLNQFPA